jgi:Beta-ketoacyl synthase, N-terminal domain
MTRLAAAIDAIALLGPGLDGWSTAREVLAGRQPYGRSATVVPPPALLPPNERRRSGLAVRIALATGAAALEASGRDPVGLRTVFASAAADGDNCHAICEQLAGSDRMISPTRFHNSVHNAPAGYWSIATRNMAPSTSVCAYDGSFAAGLLEACAIVVATGEAVLLVAYDSTYPDPLRASRPVPDAFGLALLLSPGESSASLARLEVGTDERPAEPLADPGLEALRREIPTARALPLLRRVARAQAGEAVLGYLEDLSLAVDVRPCA